MSCHQTDCAVSFPVATRRTYAFGALIVVLAAGCGKTAEDPDRISPNTVTATDVRSPVEAENGTASALPADVASAWSQVGADVGWTRYGEADFHQKGPPQAAEVPAFRFDTWKSGVVAKLPAPGQGFGVCLAATKVNDAGLKEIASLTHLQVLDLGLTEVTDAGLKELGRLAHLRSLVLYDTRVSDAGLKEL